MTSSPIFLFKTVKPPIGYNSPKNQGNPTNNIGDTRGWGRNPPPGLLGLMRAVLSPGKVAERERSFHM